MLTLLEKGKTFILQVVLLQVLIALPMLYMTRDWLFTYLNIQWKAVLPIDSRAANFTYHGIDLMKLVSTLELHDNKTHTGKYEYTTAVKSYCTVVYIEAYVLLNL